MPVYNSGAFIKESIESVLKQTYSNFEIILFYDESKDNSLEVIKSFDDSRLKLIINDGKSKGVAYARYESIKKAQGDYIAFLDSDDLWEPTKLEEQLTFMKEKNASFSATYYQQLKQETGEKSLVRAPLHLKKKHFLRVCYIGCLTVIYKNNPKINLTLYDGVRDDYSLWLQIIKKVGDCYIYPKALSTYRIYSSNLTHRLKKRRLFKQHYRLFRVQEKRTPIGAFFCSIRNALYTIIKKKKYVTRTK